MGGSGPLSLFFQASLSYPGLPGTDLPLGTCMTAVPSLQVPQTTSNTPVQSFVQHWRRRFKEPANDTIFWPINFCAAQPLGTLANRYRAPLIDLTNTPKCGMFLVHCAVAASFIAADRVRHSPLFERPRLLHHIAVKIDLSVGRMC